jgi:LAO/AO transport system kinase
MISLGDRTEPHLWRPPVLKTVADRDQGVEEVLAALDAHWVWMNEHGELERRRHVRATREIEAIALAQLRSRMGGLHGDGALAASAHEVRRGLLDPYAAADRVVASLTD